MLRNAADRSRATPVRSCWLGLPTRNREETTPCTQRRARDSEQPSLLLLLQRCWARSSTIHIFRTSPTRRRSPRRSLVPGCHASAPRFALLVRLSAAGTL